MSISVVNSKIAPIFPHLVPDAPIIYPNTFSDEGHKVFEVAQATGYPLFTLAAITDLVLNHEIVAWDSLPALKNADPCTDGADDYLQLPLVPRNEGVHLFP